MLKIVKSGMATRQVVAHFEAERQALAPMDLHTIARVLDAGRTARRASVPACSEVADTSPKNTSEDASATDMRRPYLREAPSK